MAVVEQVRFSIFSQQDIREIQNDVMKIEDLAERKNVAEEKIQQSKLSKRGGIFAPNELDDVLPSAITKKEGNSLISRVEQSKFVNSILALRNRPRRIAGIISLFQTIFITF